LTQQLIEFKHSRLSFCCDRQLTADGVEKLVGVAVLARQMSDFLRILPTD
jgi:hypothetical protein